MHGVQLVSLGHPAEVAGPPEVLRSLWAKASAWVALGSWAFGINLLCPAGAAESWMLPRLKLLPGFEAELLYQVPREQGSWVALTVDGRGRLIASDQFGPLYRVTLPAHKDAHVRVERMNLELGSAQGLLWAFDSLYVVANREEEAGGSGLFRVRDTNADGDPDQVERLCEIKGWGEHGPHAVVLGPDRRWIYLVAGNATYLPHLDRSLVPRRWAEDALVPHLMATDGLWKPDRPGGWVCRFDPEGKTFELVAIGLRNPYDIAFDARGELFTFDADMEWDLGTPWYRPTRVLHVIPGGEFGWRTGSAKWPDYYLDSLPSVYDVGESSPTGLTFGYGARFPERYQRALFLGDWSYGRIYALHLKPSGSSYTGELETFLAGAPLPITDLVIRPQDGAMYFIVGGRNTASFLYRVRHVDSARIQPQPPQMLVPPLAGRQRERKQLEEWLGRQDRRALEAAWPHLGSEDHPMRYLARAVIEHQPVAWWQEQALNEVQPGASLAALAALVRCGPTTLKHRILARLLEFDTTALSRSELLDLTRVYGLVFCRMGRPSSTWGRAIAMQLGPLFPAKDYDLNRELSQLLIYLRAPGVVEKVLDALDQAPTQEEQMHYALCLRTLPGDMWTIDQLKHLLRWFNRARSIGGGVTYNEYLNAMKEELLSHLPEAQQDAVAEVLSEPPPPAPWEALQQRPVVKHYTVEDLLPLLERGLHGRDFERGRRLFAAAMCLKCHRLNRQGGLTGPDLTGVGRRFDVRTLAESIVDPSAVISDQYATVNIFTKDDEVYSGRIGDQNEDAVLLKFDLLNPAHVRRIPWDEIDSIVPSSVSLMPEGLLDYFTEQEVLDLIAYVMSGGDPNHPVFEPTPPSRVEETP